MGGKIVVEFVIDVPLEVWIKAAREGDLDALGWAFENCRADMIQAATNSLAADLRVKEDVTDLVQETFLEAYRDFEQFTGETAAEWKAWLRTILNNNLLEVARRYRGTEKRGIHREVSIDAFGSAAGGVEQFQADTTSPSGMAMRKERSEAIRQAIERLPERDRLALYLRSHDQCTFEAMGQRLGCSAVAARNRWVSAIDRLWRELGVSSMAH